MTTEKSITENEKIKIIEQVKKLFSLAGNNPSKHEAELAMAKAQELMCKNSLTQNDVKINTAGDDDEAIITPVTNDDRRNLPLWQKKLVNIITRNFRCEYYCQRFLGRQSFQIIGLESDSKICAETICFVFRHFENTWKHFLKYELVRGPWDTRAIINAKKNDFTRGFRVGLMELFEKNVEEKGLVITTPQAVKKHMEKEKITYIKHPAQSFTGDVAASLAGYTAGTTANNNSAIAEQ